MKQRTILLMLIILLFTVMIPKNVSGVENDYEKVSDKTQFNNGTINYGVPVQFTTNPDYAGEIIIDGLYVCKDDEDYIFTVLYSNGELITVEDEIIKTSFFNPPDGDILMISNINNSNRITSDDQKIQYRVDAKLIESVTNSITIFLYDTLYNNDDENISCYFNTSDINFKEIPKFDKINEISESNSTIEVIFDSNGGSEVASIQTKNNSTITLPDNPTKDGYVFKGWYIDNQTFLNEFNVNTRIKEDLALYAKWEQVFVESFKCSGRLIFIKLNESPDNISAKDFGVSYTINDITYSINCEDIVVTNYDKSRSIVELRVPPVPNVSCLYHVAYKDTVEQTARMSFVEDVNVINKLDGTYVIKGHAHNVDFIQIRFSEFLDTEPIYTIYKEEMKSDPDDPYYYTFKVIVDNIPEEVEFVNAAANIIFCDKTYSVNCLNPKLFAEYDAEYDSDIEFYLDEFDNNSVIFNFERPENASSVKIVYTDDNGITWKGANIALSSESTSAVINGLEPNTHYYFHLVIEGGKYEGVSRLQDCTTLSNLQDLRITNWTETSAQLSFTAPTGADNIKLLLSENNGDWIEALTSDLIVKTSTSVNAIGLNPNSNYRFKLDVTGGYYEGISNTVYLKRILNGVKGTVTDANGNAVYRANVMVQTGTSSYWGTSTNNYGEFTFGSSNYEFPSGTYTAKAFAPGYNVGTSLPFTVTKGSITFGVDIELIKAEYTGSIHGTVKDTSNSPISNTYVYLIIDGFRHRISTDVNGFYSFDGIPVGNYEISVSTNGYEKYSQVVNIIAYQNILHDIIMNEPKGVKGTVVDSDGMPMQGVKVSIQKGTGSFYQETTNSEGNFIIRGEEIPTGEFTAKAFYPGYYIGESEKFTIMEGNMVEGVIIKLIKVEQTGSLSGTLTDINGIPLSNERLIITIAGYPFGVVTDINGHYSIEGLPVGNYEIHFSKCCCKLISKYIDIKPDECTINNEILIKLVTREEVANFFASNYDFQPVITEISVSDIEDSLYKDSIIEMLNARILFPYPDGTFRPENYVTIGEFATILVRAAEAQNIDLSSLSTLPPEDYKKFPDWYVNIVVNMGIYSQDVLPDDRLTEEYLTQETINILNSFNSADVIL